MDSLNVVLAVDSFKGSASTRMSKSSSPRASVACVQIAAFPATPSPTAVKARSKRLFPRSTDA